MFHQISDADAPVSVDAPAMKDARALTKAWARLDENVDAFRAKLSLFHILRREHVVVGADRIDDLHRLLLDPSFDPAPFANAGWRLIEAEDRLPTADESGARACEADAFCLALLGETSVTLPGAERALSALRRWLLLSGRSGDFPGLTTALCRQAARNGGAWPFDADERALVEDIAHPLTIAYLPPRHIGINCEFADPTTAAVAMQYEGWPYPTWERLVTFPKADRDVATGALNPVVRHVVEDARDILVAGCGTGAEALSLAMLAPYARVTAIDLSASSLVQARELCAGVDNITFRQLDLHRVADLGVTFDIVASSGVLHHLPDPEAGGRALIEVLRPGGVVSLMVYSRIARLPVYAARRRIADLLSAPVDDDLVRRVRARLIAAPTNLLAASPDFYSLAGAYDMLLHRHEDPFDLARIRRFVEANGLEMLGFSLSGPDRAQYRSNNPHDPYARDYDALQNAEISNPQLFDRMYRFWCAKQA